MQTTCTLIVEDEFVIANDLRDILSQHLPGQVMLATSVATALNKIEQSRPDVVLLDIRLRGERSGTELGQLLSSHYRIPFIYISSHADKQTLQQAVVTRPAGFLLKPFKEEEVRAALDNVLICQEKGQLERKTDHPTAELRALHNGGSMVGQAPAFTAALALAQQVAPFDMTVLLLGETGTGKELFARTVHEQSPRREQPLIKVNCAALPAHLIESELFGHEKGAFTGAQERRLGKFELAHRGTIFLDEIGELPLDQQTRLLRVLQEKEIERVGGKETLPVDVRVIAATNRDLQVEVAAGRFRADLYYRLHVFPIQVPALRERACDVPDLARFFVQRVAKQIGKLAPSLSPAVLAQLQQYAWPGNVRELQHVLERAVLLAEGDVIAHLPLRKPAPQAGLVPPPGPADGFTPQTLEEIERNYIQTTLRYCNGRIRGAGGAAELLNLHPSTLDARIRKLGIKKDFV